MTKTEAQYFRDWFQAYFGYCYGSGESHIMPAVRRFLELCDRHDSNVYDFQILEAELTPVVAWLLINALCANDVGIIDYGTSPRFAWLTPKGKRLRTYMLSKTSDELIDIATDYDESYVF